MQALKQKYQNFKKIKKKIFKLIRKECNGVRTQKPLQQIIVLTFILKIRHQTTKSIMKFLRSCIANKA